MEGKKPHPSRLIFRGGKRTVRNVPGVEVKITGAGCNRAGKSH